MQLVHWDSPRNVGRTYRWFVAEKNAFVGSADIEALGVSVKRCQTFCTWRRLLTLSDGEKKDEEDHEGQSWLHSEQRNKQERSAENTRKKSFIREKDEHYPNLFYF